MPGQTTSECCWSGRQHWLGPLGQATCPLLVQATPAHVPEPPPPWKLLLSEGLSCASRMPHLAEQAQAGLRGACTAFQAPHGTACTFRGHRNFLALSSPRRKSSYSWLTSRRRLERSPLLSLHAQGTGHVGVWVSQDSPQGFPPGTQCAVCRGLPLKGPVGGADPLVLGRDPHGVSACLPGQQMLRTLGSALVTLTSVLAPAGSY